MRCAHEKTFTETLALGEHRLLLSWSLVQVTASCFQPQCLGLRLFGAPSPCHGPSLLWENLMDVSPTLGGKDCEDGNLASLTLCLVTVSIW